MSGLLSLRQAPRRGDPMVAVRHSAARVSAQHAPHPACSRPPSPTCTTTTPPNPYKPVQTGINRSDCTRLMLVCTGLTGFVPPSTTPPPPLFSSQDTGLPDPVFSCAAIVPCGGGASILRARAAATRGTVRRGGRARVSPAVRAIRGRCTRTASARRFSARVVASLRQDPVAKEAPRHAHQRQAQHQMTHPTHDVRG
jgi:hypothetical protein